MEKQQREIFFNLNKLNEKKLKLNGIKQLTFLSEVLSDNNLPPVLVVEYNDHTIEVKGESNILTYIKNKILPIKTSFLN